MINQINPLSLTGSSFDNAAAQAAAVKEDETKVPAEDNAYLTLDTGSLDLGGASFWELSAGEIAAMRYRSGTSTKSLRGVVQDLVLMQLSHPPGLSLNIQMLGLPAFAASSHAKAKAQAAIKEDGEWGAKAVSDKIFAFAKAVSGNDSAKTGELKQAVQEGFDGAKQALGGSLPDISTQTIDAVMSKLDAWSSEPAAQAAE